MGWTIEYDPEALKAIGKLDCAIQREILDYMDSRISVAENPRDYGKPLRGSRHGLWRCRLHDYRIICQLQDRRLVVLIVTIGHRNTVYDE